MTKEEFVKGLQVKTNKLRHATIYKIELAMGVEVAVDEVEAAQHGDMLARALGSAAEQLWRDIHSEFLSRELLAKVSKLRRLLDRFQPLFLAEENKLIDEICGCLSVTPPDAGERLAKLIQPGGVYWGPPTCRECNTKMEFDEIRDHKTGELRQPPFYHCPGCGHNEPA